MKCLRCLYDNRPDAQFCIDCGAPLKPEQKPARLLCPQCRYENTPDSAFCLNCGSSLRAEAKKAASARWGQAVEEKQPQPGPKTKLPAEQVSKATCAQCGSENEKIDAFCINCGAPLKPSPPPKKTVVASAPAVEMIEIKPIPKKEVPAAPVITERQKARGPVPVPQPAVPKVVLPFEKKSAEPRRAKKWLVPAGIAAALAVIVLAVWYFALRPKTSSRPAVRASVPAEVAPQTAPAPAPADSSETVLSTESQAEPLAGEESATEAGPSSALPPPPVENKPVAADSRPGAAPARAQASAAAISSQVSRGIEAFQQKNYDQCLREMESVLAQDPGNKTAQRYLADARNKKNATAEVGRLIKAAEEAYQAGEFEKCLEQTQRALVLEPNQAEALRYEEMAHQKLAPQSVKLLVDRFNAALNSGQLMAFYETSCTPALFPKIKRSVELMNAMYSQFRSQSSQTTIRFLDDGQLEVRFSNITTGVMNSENRKLIVFEGAYLWTMQRQGDRWLIADLQSRPVRKKT